MCWSSRIESYQNNLKHLYKDKRVHSLVLFSSCQMDSCASKQIWNGEDCASIRPSKQSSSTLIQHKLALRRYVHKHAVQDENPPDLWLARGVSAVPSRVGHDMCNRGPHSLAGIWKLTYCNLTVFLPYTFLQHFIGDLLQEFPLLYVVWHGFSYRFGSGKNTVVTLLLIFATKV